LETFEAENRKSDNGDQGREAIPASAVREGGVILMELCNRSSPEPGCNQCGLDPRHWFLRGERYPATDLCTLGARRRQPNPKRAGTPNFKL